MNYLNSILWFLSWPILVYLSYRLCWYMINRYEKKGMFRTEEREEPYRE